MKKLLTLILSLIVMTMFTACGTSVENDNSKSDSSTATEQSVPKKSNSKILVVYFSRAGENYQVGVVEKGNTRILAEIIAEATGADIFEIKTVKPYPETYQECTEIAKQEAESNARPELANKIEDISRYDTIFLGYPIWWSDFPMPVYTFLENHDFNGKTIIPFCTSSEDNKLTGKEINIPSIAKGSKVLEGIGIQGKRCQDDPQSVRQDVDNWLSAMNLPK